MAWYGRGGQQSEINVAFTLCLLSPFRHWAATLLTSFDVIGNFQPNATLITHVMHGAWGKFNATQAAYVIQATQRLMQWMQCAGPLGTCWPQSHSRNFLIDHRLHCSRELKTVFWVLRYLPLLHWVCDIKFYTSALCAMRALHAFGWKTVKNA